MSKKSDESFILLCDAISSVQHACQLNFVRHAKTDLNRTGVVQGGRRTNKQTIFPLDPEDIHKFKRILLNYQFDKVYTSSALRAKETASIISTQKQIEVPELDEINWGDEIDGKPKGNDYEFLNAMWIKHQQNMDMHAENGESLEMVIDRIVASIEIICKDIVRYKYKSVLIVGHGFFFGILFGILYDKEISLNQKLENLEHRMLKIGFVN